MDLVQAGHSSEDHDRSGSTASQSTAVQGTRPARDGDAAPTAMTGSYAPETEDLFPSGFSGTLARSQFRPER